MFNLLAPYLFKNKICPLPGIGTLVIDKTPAQSDFINSAMHAPKQQIILKNEALGAADLENYLATNTHSTSAAARDHLNQFCSKLKEEIFTKKNIAIEGVGNFFLNDENSIGFEQVKLPESFFPSANVVRVIHSHAQHQMVVGDKKTNTVEMSEMLTEPIPEQKNPWWIWALVLAVIGILGILVYMNDINFSSLFGNASSIK